MDFLPFFPPVKIHPWILHCPNLRPMILEKIEEHVKPISSVVNEVTVLVTEPDFDENFGGLRFCFKHANGRVIKDDFSLEGDKLKPKKTPQAA